MIFSIKFVVTLFALVNTISSRPQNVNLLSKLPADPIEKPENWAWGLHPKDGFDFKARNSLTLEQCLLNPSVAGTPVCAGYKYPVKFCVENPRVATSKGCEGNTFPLEFCAAHPRVAISAGCKVHTVELCIKNVLPADSDLCSGAADEITFLQCVGDGQICRAKICDKRVPNKDFCKKSR